MPRQSYEDPQLSQLAALAQIAHLVSQPQHNQQELDQRDQATRLTAAIHLMGLQQEHQQNAATLDELTRHHTGELAHGQAALDAAMEERKRTNEGNITDALISHLSGRPDVPLKLLGDTLRARGHGELADSLDTAHKTEVDKRVATLLPAVQAAHAKGGDVYKSVLDSVKSDPDVWSAIQPHLPTTESPTTTAPNLATSLGKAAKFSYLASQPFGYPALVAKPVSDLVSNTTNKSLKDFFSALIGK